GVQDAGESGINGVTVTLSNGLTTTTANGGTYEFTNLVPGTYDVTFTKPAGFIATTVNSGTDDAKDSDANVTTGKSEPVSLVSGDNNQTVDAGFYKTATLGNYVWNDKDADGVQEAGEPGIDGVTVTLSNGLVTTTANGGTYQFTNLTPGTYDVTFTQPAGFATSPANSGTDDTMDSDANVATGKTGVYILNSGDSNQTVDAGYYATTSLGNLVFEDKNANGVQEAGEPGIDGVTVALSNGQTATTANGGNYQFTNLTPGTYSVTFTKPAGFTASPANSSTDDTLDSDANTATGATGVYTLNSGDSNQTVDAGFYKTAQLGNYVFEDKNANGVQDGTEPGIDGVTVTLSNGLTTTTANGGTYQFTNLTP
ncbi:MAG: SdrD B-like domain-containing protein, partial [Waterburya sp.]